ncbi:glycoside hydrolase family 6 protein [soil metagenome]
MTALRTRSLLVALASAALAAVALAATLAPSALAQDYRGVSPAAPNPLAGERLFVDPFEPSQRHWRSFRNRGKRGSAAAMWKVAREPKFRWFGRFTHNVSKTVRAYTGRARRQGSVALMSVMRHQGKACHSRYLAGGRAEDARTRRWYRKFARAVGSKRVVIAFEPDSLGTVECLAPHWREARYELLRYGVERLAALPNATVYIEAGASDWISARRMASRLRRAGVAKVRGFMLNVTHFDWTRNNVRYGRELSRRLGGKHFIVNTAANGRGPVHYRKRFGGRNRRVNVWCHPLYRGLGRAPTTQTAHPAADAYLWISRPGYSSGACNGGPKRAGDWWPRRALALVRWATDWLGPRRSLRFGHSRGKLSLRDVAGDQLH